MARFRQTSFGTKRSDAYVSNPPLSWIQLDSVVSVAIPAPVGSTITGPADARARRFGGPHLIGCSSTACSGGSSVQEAPHAVGQLLTLGLCGVVVGGDRW